MCGGMECLGLKCQGGKCLGLPGCHEAADCSSNELLRPKDGPYAYRGGGDEIFSPKDGLSRQEACRQGEETVVLKAIGEAGCERGIGVVGEDPRIGGNDDRGDMGAPSGKRYRRSETSL